MLRKDISTFTTSKSHYLIEFKGNGEVNNQTKENWPVSLSRYSYRKKEWFFYNQNTFREKMKNMKSSTSSSPTSSSSSSSSSSLINDSNKKNKDKDEDKDNNSHLMEHSSQTSSQEECSQESLKEYSSKPTHVQSESPRNILHEDAEKKKAERLKEKEIVRLTADLNRMIKEQK